jgi:hypothetical protein
MTRHRYSNNRPRQPTPPRVLSSTQRQELEALLKYTFVDPDILWEALQAAGNGVAIIGERQLDNDGNKRLALVGDAMLRLALVNKWFGTDADRSKPIKVAAFNFPH